MRFFYFLLGAGALLGALAATPARAQDGPRSLPSLARRMRAAKDGVFPALVHIVNVEENLVRGRRRKSVSSGSGFFIDEKGHIVTNYHVAGQARRLFVTLASRRKVAATIVAGDPYTDIAVLRVDPKVAWPDGKPVFARFADSDRLHEGDFVMAMGSPLSLSRSLSFGIISCRERTLRAMRLAGLETGKYNTWLQTDAAINPGNSGGPLVDLSGRVVGVNTRANLAANNIGFAIPSNVVRDVVAELIRHAKVIRSSLGLTLQPVGALADTALGVAPDGVLVAAVQKHSPAARAGIRAGDFLEALGGVKVAVRFDEELPRVYQRIARLPRDLDTVLTLRRAGRSLRVPVRAVALARELGRELPVASWGVTVRGITPAMARELRFETTAGVLVTGVRAGGLAAGRLERGDVITNVQGVDVTDLAGFLKLVTTSLRAGDRLVRLKVRKGAILDVTVLRRSP